MGYRAITEDGSKFDVDVDVVNSLGLNFSNVTQFTELQDHNGLLLSKTEIKSGKLAEDISNNKNLIKEVFSAKSPNSMNSSSELKFSNGVCIILVGIETESGEYQTLSTTFEYYLVFKTKKAINDVSDILGARFNKRDALASYERGIKSVRIKVDNQSNHMLTSNLVSNVGIISEGFYLRCENHYSDIRVGVKIVPPNFTEALSDNVRHKNIGTTADCELLEDYVKDVKEGIKTGYYTWYSGISLRSVTNM